MFSIMLIIYEMNFSSTEMEELANHGITLPPNMQGLTEDQIEDLKLKDEWAEKCVPQGGVRENKDPIGRRNGQGTSHDTRYVIIVLNCPCAFDCLNVNVTLLTFAFL